MRLSGAILKLAGWECRGTKAPVQKCIVLEAPHTSIWDFVIGFLYYRSVGGRLHTMIKKDAFFFPLNLLLRSLGAFPIDRKNPGVTLRALTERMSRDDGKVFHMVMCPEGTRKAVRKWKTGYHTLARATGLPVYLGYIDWGHKIVGLGPEVPITEDARADTDRIQKMYEDMGLIALHPEGYVTK